MSFETLEDSYNYTQLDVNKVIDVIGSLYNRVTERFPESGLRKVCRQLHATARVTSRRVEELEQPIYVIRIISGLLLALICLGLIASLYAIHVPIRVMPLPEFIQFLEAGINDIVLISAAIFFLTTLEGRIRRKQTLKFLHELRSLIHIIDMHQLTKDPGKILMSGKSTESSPEHSMTTFELSRYLDYCSELLACVGKLAAMYSQHLADPVVLSSVNEIESLATGISRKIWQKLMILHSAATSQSPQT